MLDEAVAGFPDQKLSHSSPPRLDILSEIPNDGLESSNFLTSFEKAVEDINTKYALTSSATVFHKPAIQRKPVPQQSVHRNAPYSSAAASQGPTIQQQSAPRQRVHDGLPGGFVPHPSRTSFQTRYRMPTFVHVPVSRTSAVAGEITSFRPPISQNINHQMLPEDEGTAVELQIKEPTVMEDMAPGSNMTHTAQEEPNQQNNGFLLEPPTNGERERSSPRAEEQEQRVRRGKYYILKPPATRGHHGQEAGETPAATEDEGLIATSVEIVPAKFVIGPAKFAHGDNPEPDKKTSAEKNEHDDAQDSCIVDLPHSDVQKPSNSNEAHGGYRVCSLGSKGPSDATSDIDVKKRPLADDDRAPRASGQRLSSVSELVSKFRRMESPTGEPHNGMDMGMEADGRVAPSKGKGSTLVSPNRDTSSLYQDTEGLHPRVNGDHGTLNHVPKTRRQFTPGPEDSNGARASKDFSS
ncbi:hypothetical protein CDD82_6055 [Ophiocordyceps australis]|uniref:Uncharacterized protein n=1 Tax=Ophiocordyceps australis TaxID=1399860 RepID=A0A2C5YZB6_9HYPO|nr:hypothetical protein CDD82_6055 [Ophiocordyceps australis]